MKELSELPCPDLIDSPEESIVSFYEQEEVKSWIKKLWIISAILIYVGLLLMIRGFRYYVQATNLNLYGNILGIVGVLLLLIFSTILVLTIIFRPKTNKALGMTEKRAFYCEMRGKSEYYYSSKSQIQNIELYIRPISKIIYVIATLFLLFGILMLIPLIRTSIYGYMLGKIYLADFSFIQVAIAVFFLILGTYLIVYAIIFSKRGATSTTIGNKERELRTIKSEKISEMKHFVKDVQSKFDINKGGFSGMSINTKLIAIYMFIGVIIAIFSYYLISFALTYVTFGLFYY